MRSGETVTASGRRAAVIDTFKEGGVFNA